jgi:hypothetical protein
VITEKTVLLHAFMLYISNLFYLFTFPLEYL